MTTLVFALLAFILAVAVALLVWLRRRAVAPRKMDWQDIVTAARQGGYELILTTELAAAYLKNPRNFLLVDTREPGEYQAGHLQGAVNFPLKPTRWARRRARKPLAALLGPDLRRAVVFY
ncbi:MAG: rhodanese-like domain-containing protein [Deltaproteobacteria bacterium]|nr:rhodanese-like domain-containing protein [Deltaproteobacteria bacterium]MBI4795254.1 rhodanese-like domain-containing protein [Deltaproteobacteria bacterium]